MITSDAGDGLIEVASWASSGPRCGFELDGQVLDFLLEGLDLCSVRATSCGLLLDDFQVLDRISSSTFDLLASSWAIWLRMRVVVDLFLGLIQLGLEVVDLGLDRLELHLAVLVLGLASLRAFWAFSSSARRVASTFCRVARVLGPEASRSRMALARWCRACSSPRLSAGVLISVFLLRSKRDGGDVATGR